MLKAVQSRLEKLKTCLAGALLNFLSLDSPQMQPFERSIQFVKLMLHSRNSILKRHSWLVDIANHSCLNSLSEVCRILNSVFWSDPSTICTLATITLFSAPLSLLLGFLAVYCCLSVEDITFFISADFLGFVVLESLNRHRRSINLDVFLLQ